MGGSPSSGMMGSKVHADLEGIFYGMTDMRIRRADGGDAAAIAGIYNHYIENDTCTFDTEPKTVEERIAWLQAHDDDHPVLVVERSGTVVAWGSLSVHAERPAWRHTVQVGTYVAPGHEGTGLGSALMDALLEASRAAGHHVVLAQIVADNERSLALVERYGFERVGVLREVGRKFDRWLDVVVLQRIL